MDPAKVSILGRHVDSAFIGVHDTSFCDNSVPVLQNERSFLSASGELAKRRLRYRPTPAGVGPYLSRRLASPEILIGILAEDWIQTAPY